MKEWTKIGEIVRTAPFFANGIYARYAVMEMICASGMRKYKEVFMCSWTEEAYVESQPNPA